MKKERYLLLKSIDTSINELRTLKRQVEDLDLNIYETSLYVRMTMVKKVFDKTIRELKRDKFPSNDNFLALVNVLPMLDDIKRYVEICMIQSKYSQWCKILNKKLI